MKRAALLSVIGVLLLGAPAQAQIYRANDTGGIIPWSCENEAMAQQIAGAYCARDPLGWASARTTAAGQRPIT